LCFSDRQSPFARAKRLGNAPVVANTSSKQVYRPAYKLLQVHLQVQRSSTRSDSTRHECIHHENDENVNYRNFKISNTKSVSVRQAQGFGVFTLAETLWAVEDEK